MGSAHRSEHPVIYLHIGAMKTGTTYLQTLMSEHREQLVAAGYLFPGERWVVQSRAVREMLFKPGDDPRLHRQTDGRWDELRQEMFDHRGRASIVSMEFLSFADAERARRIVESLDGAEVHVIVTVRDAHRAIPGQWQTACRNGGRIPYRKLLQGVEHALAGEPGRGARLIERTQGIPRMLDVWTPLVGPDRMHVITVPPTGSDPALLWHRFADAVGVDPDLVQVTTEVTNPSLGYASSELLRRINRRLGPVPPLDYWRVVKGGLARTILAPRAGREQRVPLPRRGVRLANRWNRVVRKAIRSSGAHVYGDLRDLPSAPPGEEVPATLTRPTPDELLAAAATARLGLQRLHDYLLRRAEVTAQYDEEEAPEVDPPEPTTGDEPVPAAWLEEDDPVAAALDEVVATIRGCIAVHQSITTADLDDFGGLDEPDDCEDDPDDSDEDDEDDDEDGFGDERP